MRLTNFRDLKKSEGTLKEGELLYATVTAITRVWPFKRRDDVVVCKYAYTMHWFFADSGKYTPGSQCEDLYAAYKARKKIEDIEKAEKKESK